MTAPTTEITVLAQADCAFCEHAAEVLARVGQDHPLTLRYLDLGSEQGLALAAEHGVLFAPGIFMDGRLLSYGRLSERLLRRALARRATPAQPGGSERGAGHR